MTIPGWYTDPAGSGGIRWWDGSQWTEHVQPAPAPAGSVFDQKVRGLRLYADSRIIAYGKDSLELAQVHWVTYSATELRFRTGFFDTGSSPLTAEWRFWAGQYPFKQTPVILTEFSSESIQTEPAGWAFLVRLSRTSIEPRLVSELVNRVRSGETVDVGQGVRVNAGGFTGGKISLPWSAVAGTSSGDGHIWIYQAGAQKPALRVPHQNPNAILIPPLFDALMRG